MCESKSPNPMDLLEDKPHAATIFRNPRNPIPKPTIRQHQRMLQIFLVPGDHFQSAGRKGLPVL